MPLGQTVQLLITLLGIALGVVAFLLAPFGMLANGAIAFIIFVGTGVVANLAYARIASPEEKIKNLRDRVDNPIP